MNMHRDPNLGQTSGSYMHRAPICGSGGKDVELEEVDDDDSGSVEVRSQLDELDCSLPPPVKAQLGGSQLETLANSDLPCNLFASSRNFSEVPVVYALLWLLDSAAFKEVSKPGAEALINLSQNSELAAKNVSKGIIKTTMNILYKQEPSITRLLVMFLVNLTQLGIGIDSLLQV
ncbi:hypothetical protein LOK49_Contig566G00001 [Camellia lanceoleosa]|nr:hypothetical protein LOK49_Contig566G00001 [Camellia lanceoleosa]